MSNKCNLGPSGELHRAYQPVKVQQCCQHSPLYSQAQSHPYTQLAIQQFTFKATHMAGHLGGLAPPSLNPKPPPQDALWTCSGSGPIALPSLHRETVLGPCCVLKSHTLYLKP